MKQVFDERNLKIELDQVNSVPLTKEQKLKFYSNQFQI